MGKEIFRGAMVIFGFLTFPWANPIGSRCPDGFLGVATIYHETVLDSAVANPRVNGNKFCSVTERWICGNPATEMRPLCRRSPTIQFIFQ
jgi:hypothetical protein